VPLIVKGSVQKQVKKEARGELAKLKIQLENGRYCSNSVSLICCGFVYFIFVAFTALTLLVGRQEGHPACKKWGMVVGTTWSRWSGAQPDGRCVCLC